MKTQQLQQMNLKSKHHRFSTGAFRKIQFSLFTSGRGFFSSISQVKDYVWMTFCTFICRRCTLTFMLGRRTPNFISFCKIQCSLICTLICTHICTGRPISKLVSRSHLTARKIAYISSYFNTPNPKVKTIPRI